MDKILSLAGLARRAGKAVSGEFSAEEALKKGKARLVILAEDASENTKKKFADRCAYRRTELISYGSKASLGQALGQEERAVLAITDEGFAAAVLKAFHDNKE